MFHTLEFMTKVSKNRYKEKLEECLLVFHKMIECCQNLLSAIPRRFKSKTKTLKEVNKLILRAILTLSPTKRRFKVHNQLNRGYVVFLVNKLKELWKNLEKAGLTEVQVGDVESQNGQLPEDQALKRYEKILKHKRQLELQERAEQMSKINELEERNG